MGRSNRSVHDPFRRWPAVNRCSSATLAEFLESIEELMRAGLTLADAVATMQSAGSSAVRDLATNVTSVIDDGASLASAIEATSRPAESTRTALLATGSRCGSVVEALASARSYSERIRTLRKRAISAAIYPAFIPVMLVIFLSLISSSSLPGFDAALLDHLLAITRRLLGSGIIVVALTLVGAGFLVARGRRGDRVASLILSRMPLVGGLERAADRWRCATTTWLMVRGGEMLVPSLREASRNASLEASALALERASESIEGGFVQPDLNSSALPGFSRMLGRVAAGSDLVRAARLWERETWARLERTITALGSACEPAFSALAGASVVVFALAFVRPLLLGSLQGIL